MVSLFENALSVKIDISTFWLFHYNNLIARFSPHIEVLPSVKYIGPMHVKRCKTSIDAL